MFADSLRAEVRFKGNGLYDLGDLMEPVVNRWRKKLGDAIKAAKSWDQDEHVMHEAELFDGDDDVEGDQMEMEMEMGEIED